MCNLFCASTIAATIELQDQVTVDYRTDPVNGTVYDPNY